MSKKRSYKMILVILRLVKVFKFERGLKRYGKIKYKTKFL